jgi:4-amino-4-deoxy-L-arabinose transferase-like glycosyltransferase
MSETLVMLLVALAIVQSYRFRERPAPWSAALLGVPCGLLVMTRSEQLLLVVFLLAPLVAAARVQSMRMRLGSFAVAVAVTSAFVAPWAAYNSSRFERPVPLTTEFGSLLRVSNCDSVYYGDRLGYFDLACSDTDLEGDASTRDRVLLRRALRYIRGHVSRVPLVIVAREARTWGLYAPREQMRFDERRGTEGWIVRAAFAGYWLLVVWAVAGTISLRRRKVAVFPLFAFVSVVAVAVAIGFGQTRYRAPAEVPLVLLAAVAIESASTRMHSVTRRGAVKDPAGANAPLTVGTERASAGRRSTRVAADTTGDP